MLVMIKNPLHIVVLAWSDIGTQGRLNSIESIIKKNLV